jgi:hypothetical protein
MHARIVLKSMENKFCYLDSKWSDAASDPVQAGVTCTGLRMSEYYIVVLIADVMTITMLS